MANHIRRREFIFTLGGAAVAWPLAVRAQQPAPPVIGFLSASSPEASGERMRGFHLGLKEAGYVGGDNVTVLYRWAEAHMDRLPELAADLVRRGVAVVACFGNAAALAAKAATTTVPVVFAVSEDPVRVGLVASLARPGGNLTGVNYFSAELVAKRLELLRALHLATLHKVPATYPERQFTETGGLMSYGANYADVHRQIGVYAGRILKGAKALELPVVQSSKFELVINAETARMLGLTVPPTLLATADEVIE